MCIVAAAPVAAGAAAGGLSTSAMISLGASLVGTAMSAYGQYQQGQAQEAQYRYQAAVAQNNKIIADQNAADAIKRGEAAVDEHRRQVSQIKGSQRAGIASGGVMVDSGSALDIISDTEMMGELDAQTIKHNSEMEARNYRLQGDGFTSEAALLNSSAKNASTAGTIGAAGTILGGAGQFADSWYEYKKKP